MYSSARRKLRPSVELMRATSCCACSKIADTPHHKGQGKGRANTGQRNPEVPRPKATTATAEAADPKFHECLARGGTRYEAFKQHKSRLRTRAFQDFYGLEPTSPESREARPPPMMSQGGLHRRLVMSRLRSLADRGFVPTDDELIAGAVSMEHLANLVADRARAATGQGEEFSEAEPEEDDQHAAPSRSRSRR